jgi:uncharacterized protein
VTPQRSRTAVHAGRDVPGGTQVELELDTSPERVPATLLIPNESAPAPAALLLHGFTSHKERMVESVGRALLRVGVASIAIDLPLHGSREGSIDEISMRNPLQVVKTWRDAVTESRQALHYLAEHPAVDPRRIGLVGYSLGAFLGLVVASSDALVRVVALAAGGDLPDRTPFASLVRTVADPLRAVRALKGRRLLMVNGRSDRTVTAAQAERLFGAADEPKEIRWYPGGHWPPHAEIEFTARWLADALVHTPRSRAPALGSAGPAR